jgi:7-cyano-7-deazaguanine synthase in queuosine biosynthesis
MGYDMSLIKIAREIMESASLGKGIVHLPSDEMIEIGKEVCDEPERPGEWKPDYSRDRLNAVLVSGGLDSSVLWWMTEEPKEGFYIDIGQEYCPKEVESLSEMGIPYKMVSLKTDIMGLNRGRWKHILPGRNLLFFFAIAELYPLGEVDIYFASTNGEMPLVGGDKSYRFLRLVNDILKPYGKKVVTPLEKMTKTDEVRWCIENGYLDKIKHSISCFSGEVGRCGKCQSCLRTWIAFSNNGVEIDFRVDPVKNCGEYIDKYVRVMGKAVRNGDYSHYTRERVEESFRAFRRIGYRV